MPNAVSNTKIETQSKLGSQSPIFDESLTPWNQFKRPYVRDLAYVLACPDVLTRWIDFAPNQDSYEIAVHSIDFWTVQFEAYRQRLEELDSTNAYQELTRYLLKRPSPNRLGFHFEGLLSFWLDDGFVRGVHSYETMASNIQLFDGKQTIGELDLILYNHNEALVEHWELAIKFFMGAPPFTPAHWVGINSNDNLERKMTYMQTKQFTTVWVDTTSYGRVEIDKRYGVIKGRFFLPLQTQRFDKPCWLTSTFPTHEWCDENDDATLATFDTSMLRAARYIEWFSKRDFYDDRHPEVLSPNSTKPRTGLYFLGQRPIVIYPRASSE